MQQISHRTTRGCQRLRVEACSRSSTSLAADGVINAATRWPATFGFVVPLLLQLLALLESGEAGPLVTRSPPPSPTLPAVLTLQGKLLYRTTQPVGTWVLAVSKSDATYRLPWQPEDAATGQPIPPATWISLACNTDGLNVPRCASISDVKVVRTAAETPPPTADQTLRLLVMTVNLSSSAACEGQPGLGVQEVMDLFLQPDGHVSFFDNCSYGKMVIDMNASKVVSSLVPCSQAILACDHDAISLGARKQLPDGVRPSAFSHLLYILPIGIVQTCGWLGLADVPGTQTWFAPDILGIYRKATVMQELLHNFGLYHGWRNGKEYEDYSTAMGYGDSCPSAPELRRLGWATPLAQLNSACFPLATFVNFTLPATYLGPTGVMVKIQPDWLGSSYTKNVYLAYRLKTAGDSGLLQTFNRKLNIHELNKDIDNDPSAEGDPRVSLLGVVSPGANTTLAAYKMYIIAGAMVNSNTSIQIKVCRFRSSINECTEGPMRFTPPVPPEPLVRQSPSSPPPSPPPALPSPPPPPPRHLSWLPPPLIPNRPSPPPRPPLFLQRRPPPFPTPFAPQSSRQFQPPFPSPRTPQLPRLPQIPQLPNAPTSPTQPSENAPPLDPNQPTSPPPLLRSPVPRLVFQPSPPPRKSSPSPPSSPPRAPPILFSSPPSLPPLQNTDIQTVIFAVPSSAGSPKKLNPKLAPPKPVMIHSNSSPLPSPPSPPPPAHNPPSPPPSRPPLPRLVLRPSPPPAGRTPPPKKQWNNN
ncbi:hypothetical protein Vretimale_12953 [Volvox reticuliferus]|uniref:Uncharacterized protein n=1 Tax=Volvox reticuliferus TaxID=1737510 RepID=A0A8J4CED0_9CHLO|nr:hypothetical protein Vretifemale_9320 [Volvox reticuliferus]GIM09084.1 hypothetical protein Vretimale_12953 [Volvox reticuliferus]